MKRLVTFCVVLLVAAFASAFTPEEEAEILRLRSMVTNARIVMFYAGDELKTAQTVALQQASIAVGLAAWNVHWEAEQALDHLVGSFSTDIPGNNPLDFNLTPQERVNDARFFLGRVAPYRTTSLRAALASAIAAGAQTKGIIVYSVLFVSAIESARNLTNLDLASGFFDREPAWWPFLVRRSSDGVGLHGHFEFFAEGAAQGMGYLADGRRFMLEGAQLWVGPMSAEARLGVRNDLLAFKDLMAQLDSAILAAFDVGVPEGQDQFFRTFNSIQQDLIGGGSGITVMEQQGMTKVIREALLTNQSAAAVKLGQAVQRTADGWFRGVDFSAWEQTRFPCILGFESRGCAEGFPPDPLLPQ